jgi:hypothetical protein
MPLRTTIGPSSSSQTTLTQRTIGAMIVVAVTGGLGSFCNALIGGVASFQLKGILSLLNVLLACFLLFNWL